MNHLYALLVGIDSYPTKPLTGCVNDVRAWRRYLEERTGDGGQLSLEVLVNEEATRQAILERFRAHLGQAGKGDTALFCFSGHGSQELAPEPYCWDEPGGLSETLVAVDSRVEGGFDIADKELAVLIAEVARGGAHVVVALDSCHSGTATRASEEGFGVRQLGARRMSGSKRRRPAGSYWFQEGVSLPQELDAAGGWRVLPSGPHVLLAACEDRQTAIESSFEGEDRGLFSAYLLDTLARMGPGWSYQELFQQVQTRVRNTHPDQLPQAEGELNRSFLEGAVVHRRAGYHARLHKDDCWWLDAGAMHGIRVDTDLAILPLDPSGSEDLSRRLAVARVVDVEAGRSRLEVVEGEVPAGPPAYPAVVTRLPLPPMRVSLRGETAGRARLREAIERSPYLALSQEPSADDLLVILAEGRWRLRRPGTDWDLIPDLAEAGAIPGRLVEVLEHVARWQTIAGLANPESPLHGAIEMTLWEWNPPGAQGRDPDLQSLPDTAELRLPYRETTDGTAEPRRICVRLVNRSSSPLYFGLFALGETFSVTALSGGVGRLDAGEEVWVGRGSGIRAAVPEDLHLRGVTQRRDLLVLLVSSVATNFSLLEQAGVAAEPGRRSPPHRALPARPGVLETLLRRAAWRELEDQPAVADQWAARSRAMVTVRSLPWHPLPEGDTAVEPVPGVRLRVPRGLRGAVRLHGPATRPQPPGLAGISFDLQERLRPVGVAGALGSDPGLSTVELRAARWDRVSPEAPLLLETDLVLGEEERLAAVLWDGKRAELIASFRDGSGPSGCRIEALPAPAAGGGTVCLDLYVLRD